MSEFLKILHVIGSVNPTGGGPIEGVRQLHDPITKYGHSVEIVSCDDPNAPWLQQPQVCKVHALGPGKLRYGYSPHLVPWLKLNARNYDVVIVNGIWGYTSFAAWHALARTKTPYFVFTHGMLDPWFKHTFPLKHLKKWLYWPWAEYRVLRDARRVIFTCEDEKILARQSFWLYKVNEAVTSYGVSNPPGNSIELAKNFISKFSHLKGKRIALYLSRIHVKKGCDLLIDAFAKAVQKDPNLHLIIAGPDQTGWVPALKAQAKLLGLEDKITWPGMLQGEMKWGAFYAAEVFVLPSHQENFGIVVAEALACGKPVLISNKVNIWREIEADGAGIVENDTLEGTENLFNRWLEMSPKEFADTQSKTVSCFEKRFHVQRAAERLLDIIQESI